MYGTDRFGLKQKEGPRKGMVRASFTHSSGFIPPVVSSFRVLLHPSLPCLLPNQGREVSVFSRLWLVNRTEMVLQHREVSLAMDVDATFMGDRMPQVLFLGRG